MIAPLQTIMTSFPLKNGAINDGYYYDNIHLTLKVSDANKSIGLKKRSGTMSTKNIHPRQTSPLTWEVQPPAQRVVYGVPHHKANKVKGSGNQHNQPQQHSKMHPSSTSNRVSPGGYSQKAPTGNHHHSPASMDSTPPADFQHSFWAKARGKVRQNRTTRQMRTGQSHTRTKDPRADKHGDKPRTYQPPSRDRCEHCGETGHNTGRCRHGGPINCPSCGELAHKSKHCHCAQTDDFYRGYWRDAYEEVASKDSSMMNWFPCHYSTSTVMKQVSVCSSIYSKNDVGDCDKSPSSSIIRDLPL